jgi:hypothetical protein
MFRTPRVLAGAIVTAAVLAAAVAGASRATAPPVGPLPNGPNSTIQTQKGQLVAVALPHTPNGRVWRIVGSLNSKIVVEAGEGDVGTNVVIIFKATGPGTTTVTFANTRGETAHVYQARRFTIRVK